MERRMEIYSVRLAFVRLDKDTIFFSEKKSTVWKEVQLLRATHGSFKEPKFSSQPPCLKLFVTLALGGFNVYGLYDQIHSCVHTHPQAHINKNNEKNQEVQ